MRRALIILALLLAACGESYTGPLEGYVTRHEYDDPDDEYIPGYTIDGGQTCTGGYGSDSGPRVCHDNPDTVIPARWDHDPAHFWLHLENGDDTGRFQVDEATYNRVRDGQWFNTETGQVEPR